MLHFLDVILSPQDLERINQSVNQRWGRTPNRPRGTFNVPEFNLYADTAAAKYTPAIDSASVDSIVKKGVADSIPNKEGVIDTLKASVTNTNGTAGDDTTALIWTALVIIAALALCFCFIRLYRKSLPSVC